MIRFGDREMEIGPGYSRVIRDVFRYIVGISWTGIMRNGKFQNDGIYTIEYFADVQIS